MMKNIFRKIIYRILRIESKLILWKYKPKIIAITGSIGKTSTKDAIYAVFSKILHVRKSEKSYNSEIGLPLTILGSPNGWSNPILWLKIFWKGLWLFLYPHKYPKWLILEVGVGKAGDMKKTALWFKTDIVVITAIGETPAHIEFFYSRKHLIDEKSALIKTLKKDGLLILNADDKAVLEMKAKTKNQILTFGFSEEVDILGSSLNISYKNDVPRGIVFRVDEEGSSLPVIIDGVFGKNHVYASLAALAICSGLKFNMIDAVNSLKNYDVPPGRMRLLSGINNSLIMDDTYNSSPFACESALQTLSEIKGNRKIAVLGDMLELGKYTIEAHRNIGKIVKNTADVLMVLGPRAQEIKKGALEKGMAKKNIFEFSNAIEVGEFLQGFVQNGDLILIKGSQGMRMERAVATILFDNKNQDKLLVRQDKEWQKR